MATRWAVASGNWSNTATWNGGTLPAAGDDVHANNFTVTIDQAVNVASLRTTAGSGIAAGGVFSITSARTVTLTGAQGTFPGSTANPCIAINHSTGTVILAAVISGSASASMVGVTINGAGNVNVIGSVTAIGATGLQILNSATGTYTVTGDVVGGASGSAAGILVQTSTSTVTVTGNLTAGGTGTAITTVGTLHVVGSISAAGQVGVLLSTGSTLVHTGIVSASAGANGISGGPTNFATCTGPFVSSANRMAVYAQLRIATSTTTTYWEFPSGDGGTRRLYTADNVGGNPAAGNVRQGTVYGPSNELTGTLIVPNPANVASGVPTDNTLGTAALTPEAFWNHLAASSTTPGSLGKKLADLQTAIVVVS